MTTGTAIVLKCMVQAQVKAKTEHPELTSAEALAGALTLSVAIARGTDSTLTLRDVQQALAEVWQQAEQVEETKRAVAAAQKGALPS